MENNTNEIYEQMRKKVEALKSTEKRRSADEAMSLQFESDVYSFSPEDKTLTLSFPVLKKELNPNGAMIGGLICTAIDMTYGILVYGLTEGKSIPPTITMTTNFINPIMFGDTLLVTAKIESWGKRIINMTAVGTSKNNGKTIVTSTTSFISDKSFRPLELNK